MIQEKERLCRNIEKREEIYSRISQKIWEYAELGFKEHRSAKLLQETLEREGFQVETGLAGIPTAFKGTFGSGGPVIAILGEFDALPGLSQKPGTDVQEKREDTDCGHGCGHNLLGTGSQGISGPERETGHYHLFWLSRGGKRLRQDIHGTGGMF